MFKIAAVALGLAVLGSARPMGGGHVRECRVGNVSLPLEVYESYAGFECYESTYPKLLAVCECIDKSGDVEYSVPCFKVGSNMMSFNLKNEDTVLEILYTFRAQELNDMMVKCYLDLVSGRGGRGYRTFLFNTTDVCALSGQSRFHVAMLIISLILAVPIVIIFSFCSWDTNNTGVCHCRNVLMALACRTFFTLLVETEVIAKRIELPGEEMDSWAGCKALASFEQITLNLVLAFWLIFTLYLSEYSKNEFVKEPDVKRGAYILLGLSLAMAVIWMIIMGAGEYGLCWMEKTAVNWVNNSLRVGFIIVQTVLISIATYHVLTDPATFDDTQKDILRRAVVFTLALSPLFLLQFSLNAGHAVNSDNVYVYTEHFFDGMQSGIVSLMYLFVMGVHEFLMDKIRLRGHRKCHIVLETARSREVEIGKAPIKVPKPGEDCPEDVIYSSVLTPERFEKTIKLYNRLNIILQHERAGMKEGLPRKNPDNISVISDYFDVESIHTVYDDVLENSDPNLTPKQVHKYYDSKYLVHDTDSSVSDDSVKEGTKPKSSGSEISERGRGRMKAMESRLQNHRREFQDHVEKQMKNKDYNSNDMHRSHSGVLLSSFGTPKSVKANTEKSTRARRASAPSVLLQVKPETFFSLPPENGLPSIYHDLKHTKRPKTRKEDRDRRGDSQAKDRHTHRDRELLASKQETSEVHGGSGGVEEEGLGSQLNALISPRYDAGDLEPGDLLKNKFSFNTERLNVEASD